MHSTADNNLKHVLLADETAPLQVRIEAFNPMTPADTAALSMPMYAHSAIDAAREMAWALDPPLTFQPLALGW